MEEIDIFGKLLPTRWEYTYKTSVYIIDYDSNLHHFSLLYYTDMTTEKMIVSKKFKTIFQVIKQIKSLIYDLERS